MLVKCCSVPSGEISPGSPFAFPPYGHSTLGPSPHSSEGIPLVLGLNVGCGLAKQPPASSVIFFSLKLIRNTSVFELFRSSLPSSNTAPKGLYWPRNTYLFV